MFAIKSARQWTNTDSLVRRGRCLDLINIHLLIFSRHSPAFSPLSPSSSSSVPVSSTSFYLLRTTLLHRWWLARANGTILFAVGRLFVRAFILRLLSGAATRFTQPLSSPRPI